MVTNVLALSVMCALTDIVTRRALREAVRTSVREEFLEQNLKAMDFGYRLAVEHLKKMSPRRRKELPELSCLRAAAKSGKETLPISKT
jgi:hypothetical protein